MLPFTKRPGRGDDDEVFTKEDFESGEPRPAMRKPAPSVTDEDEATKHMPRKALGNAINAILPAAGRPATVPPPSRSRPPPSVRPPPSSRPMAIEEEDEGRTVVRGGPKIVKKKDRGEIGQPTVPTTFSPSAVIKQSLDAARAGQRPDPMLMAPPPKELLEDLADRIPPSVPPPPSSTSHLHSHGMPIPPPSQRHYTGPPPPAPASYPPSNPYAYGQPPPSQSMSRSVPLGQPPPSQSMMSRSAPSSASSAMPAHFMVAQADPPAVAVTSGHMAGRPAMSWAGALLAFGIFVGVGAVAVMQSNESLMEMTASFVDPSRAAAKAQAAPQGAPVPVPMNPSEPAPPPAITVNAAPPPPVAVNTLPPAPAAEPTPEPPATTSKPAHASRPVFWGAPAPKKEPRESAPPPAAAAPPPPKKEPPPAKPAAVAANEEDPKPEKKPAKGAAKPGGKGGAESDEETRKAIEALQKSQLESSF